MNRKAQITMEDEHRRGGLGLQKRLGGATSQGSIADEWRNLVCPSTLTGPSSWPCKLLIYQTGSDLQLACRIFTDASI